MHVRVFWMLLTLKTLQHSMSLRTPNTRAQEMGGVPVIAEDLGVITPDVVALREAIAAPGMVVLQFAWGSGATNVHLPHNHYENSVCYPGGFGFSAFQGVLGFQGFMDFRVGACSSRWWSAVYLGLLLYMYSVCLGQRGHQVAPAAQPLREQRVLPGWGA